MFKDKFESLEKIHKALLDKALDIFVNEHEISLQNFITICIERTKLDSIIYGVIKSK